MTLTDNEVTGAERAGILVDGSGFSVTASGNAISSVGHDPSGSNAILAQGGATVTGSDETRGLPSGCSR